MRLRHRHLLVHPSRDRDGPRLILGPVTRLVSASPAPDSIPCHRPSRTRPCIEARRSSSFLPQAGPTPPRAAWPEAVCGCQRCACQRIRRRATSNMTPVVTTQIDLGCSISVSSIRLSHQSNPRLLPRSAPSDHPPWTAESHAIFQNVPCYPDDPSSLISHHKCAPWPDLQYHAVEIFWPFYPNRTNSTHFIHEIRDIRR